MSNQESGQEEMKFNRANTFKLIAIHCVFTLMVFTGAALSPQDSAAEDDGKEKGRLWVTIQDEDGKPTGARLYVKGSDGTTYIPEGSLARGRGSERFFHSSGHFQMALPLDKIQIRAVKGFEYLPVDEEVNLEFIELNDRTTGKVLTMKRLIDMPARGWFSGDVHMHPNHRIGGLYITMEDCLVLAQGEDIKVANLLISNRQETVRVFDKEFFRDGEIDPLSTPETLLAVQEEFRNADGMYGHMVLLGIDRLITPFYTGVTPNWEDYPPNYMIAKQAKDQGGVVSYAHPASEVGIPDGYHEAREFPIDLALGVVDALDLLSNMDEEGGSWMYYRVLNTGLKCTASAGTDTQMDSADRSSISGGSKVYVKLDPPLTYEKWLEGYRNGRTFVTNGPLLTLTVDGNDPGGELQLKGPAKVEISAEATSIVPFETLELIVNGERVASVTSEENGKTAKLEQELELTKSSWIAAKVTGQRHPLVMNDSAVFAHTSPVYVYLDGQPISSPEDAQILVNWIDQLIEDVETRGRFSTEERRREVLEIFRKGRRYYEERTN